MAKRPIYYDTETTGLNAKNERIIEIAAYDPVLNKTYSQLINPQMPIPEESSAICNITDEMVKDAPSFEEVGRKFIEFCTGDVVLVAHNNDNFDRLFLEAEFQRNDIQMPSWHFLDSLKWAKKYRPDLPKHALQYLRQIYEIEENQAHRALDDVIVLHKVFEKMIDDLSIEKAMELLYQKKSRFIEYMPFGKHQGKKLTEVPKSYIRWLQDSSALDKLDNKNLKESFIKLNLLEEV